MTGPAPDPRVDILAEQVKALDKHSAHDDPDSAAAAYDLGRLHAFGRAAALVGAARPAGASAERRERLISAYLHADCIFDNRWGWSPPGRRVEAERMADVALGVLATPAAEVRDDLTFATPSYLAPSLVHMIAMSEPLFDLVRVRTSSDDPGGVVRLWVREKGQEHEFTLTIAPVGSAESEQ